MAAPRSILLVRVSAIGDVIMASGLIPALRQTYPDARLGWLTEDSNKDLLASNPRLSRLHLWPRRRWRDLRDRGHYFQYLKELRGLISELRGERYDWVVDLQGLLKSAIWARLAGGNRRIGLGPREGTRLLMTEALSRRVDDNRIGKEYRMLAEYLGAPPDAFALDIAISDRVRRETADLLRQENITGIYSVIAPFTTRPQKHWQEERWPELAARLAERGSVVMLGGPGDRARAVAIEHAAGGNLIDLTGMTDLDDCAAIIEHARVLIGVDTGLTHLGIAVGTPTVALFGSTRPYLDMGDAVGRVLYQPMPCSPCRRRPTCDGAYNCMALHSVDDVFKASLEILGEQE